MWAETELAYLAGLLDGEGTISVYCSDCKVKGFTYSRIRMMVKVYNSDLVMLNWIKNKFGGLIYEVGKDRPTNWKRGFAWQIGHKQAAQILRLCLPFLITKRRQAEIFITISETTKRRGSNGTPSYVLALREELMGELRTLTRRGVDALAA
jgi:hypothetical protein